MQRKILIAQQTLHCIIKLSFRNMDQNVFEELAGVMAEEAGPVVANAPPQAARKRRPAIREHRGVRKPSNKYT